MSNDDYKRLLSQQPKLPKYNYTNNTRYDFDDFFGLPDKYETDESATETSTNTGSNTTTSLGTTTTTDLSKIYNGVWHTTHTHAINSVWNDIHNIKQDFSKSEFLESLSKGESLVSVLDKLVDNLTNNGVIECIEFIDRIGLLNSDIFWSITYKKHSTYIMYPEYHSVDMSASFIEYTKNKNFIQYTREDIRESNEFTRRINTLKLKGKL